jgi:hypothetical protein
VLAVDLGRAQLPRDALQSAKASPPALAMPHADSGRLGDALALRSNDRSDSRKRTVRGVNLHDDDARSSHRVMAFAVGACKVGSFPDSIEFAMQRIRNGSESIACSNAVSAAATQCEVGGGVRRACDFRSKMAAFAGGNRANQASQSTANKRPAPC